MFRGLNQSEMWKWQPNLVQTKKKKMLCVQTNTHESYTHLAQCKNKIYYYSGVKKKKIRVFFNPCFDQFGNLQSF